MGAMRLACYVGVSVVVFCALLPGQERGATAVSVEAASIRVEFNSLMHSRVVARFDGKPNPVGGFGPSEFLLGDSPIQDFTLTSQKRDEVRDERGHGRRLTITGKAGGLQKTVALTAYDAIPRMIFYRVRYTNQSGSAIRLTGWTNNRYSVDAKGSAEPAFWSYQSGSYRNRPDWVLPLKVNFKQENFLGMNSTD